MAAEMQETNMVHRTVREYFEYEHAGSFAVQVESSRRDPRIYRITLLSGRPEQIGHSSITRRAAEVVFDDIHLDGTKQPLSILYNLDVGNLLIFAQNDMYRTKPIIGILT